MAKGNIKTQKRVTRNGKIIIEKSKKNKISNWDILGFIIIAVAAVTFIIAYLSHLISDLTGS